MKDNVVLGDTNMYETSRLSYLNLNKRVAKLTQFGMFVCVVLLALLPPGILLAIYSLGVTVACPLIATVLPGFFYYTITRDSQDNPEDKTNKCQLWMGFIYFLFNLICMPLLLMLTMYTI